MTTVTPHTAPHAALDAAISHIAKLVEDARQRSFRAANAELVHLYWSVGQYLSQQCQREGWGQGTVKTLAQLLLTREPEMKGFSAQNLWRMKQFFEAYDGDEELSTQLRELPWSANLHLLSKCKNRQERAFYLQWMRQEGWSVRQLAQQIDGALWAAAGFMDTLLRCEDETGGGLWKREGNLAESSKLKRSSWLRSAV